MKTLSNILILSSLVLLAGCNPPESTHSVEWYETHDGERYAFLHLCRDNPGERLYAPNCMNAEHAENKRNAAKTGTLRIEPMTQFKLGGK